MMNILLSKKISEMTGHELLELLQSDAPKKYVYGIDGIATLFNCSIPTANRIKGSGKIDKAIKQIGRKIIVDAEMALELASEKKRR